MTRKKRRETPEWKWEQALIDDYYDYRWRQVLSPLHAKFERWEAGELDHWDMDHAIHETHKENQHLYTLFNEKRSYLVTLIQCDEEWFGGWITNHPPPPGIELAPWTGRPAPDDGQTTPDEGITPID